jgi:F-type H+-transporting ATPase subunit b
MNINATLIGQSIAFFIFIYLVKQYIWPPLIAAMEERQKRIENGLLAAERGLSEQAEAEQRAQELIGQSKDQAAEILANASKQASSMVEEAKDVAIQAAEQVKQQASAQLEQDKVRVRNELQMQVSDLVMQGVSAVLSKEVDGKAHKAMLAKLAQTL